MFYLWFSEHINFDVNRYTLRYWCNIKPSSDVYRRAWYQGSIY